jgi:peptidyl-prolyl cis-trans isomerase C
VSTVEKIELEKQGGAAVSINGVAIDEASIREEAELHTDAEDPIAAARQSLAIRELLRQRAVELQLVRDDGDALDDAAVDRLLARDLRVPSATRADCQRYYEGHLARFRRNDIVFASHILFAVTGRVPLALLRQQAESTLARVLAAPETFEGTAKEVSNCPSAGVGGSLGQLLRGDSVPEFELALFDTQNLGIVSQLINTRFGFHIVRIDRRVDGEQLPFEAVEADVARFLGERVMHKAMQQYVSVLASRARIEGVDLGETNGPLVQ